MPADARLVSITSAGTDGSVVGVQVTGPEGCPVDMLRGQLVAAVLLAVGVFESGRPVEVAVGDVRMSVRKVG